MILDKLVEITFKNKEDFLKIKETLTRIGISSKHENKLTQTCHILHKKGKYYITHFKEMFLLDGKTANLTEEDIARRNSICNLLNEWELVDIVTPEKTKNPVCDLYKIKIIPFNEKGSWNLVSKYTVGTRK